MPMVWSLFFVASSASSGGGQADDVGRKGEKSHRK